MRKATLFFILLMVAGLFCVSCRTKHEIQTEYVYIERSDSLRHLSSKIDSLLRESIKRDSIHEKDSVSVVIKGDTVMIDRWHTIYKESSNYDNQKEKELVYDTVYQTHTEYIDKYIEKEVIQEVNKLYWWQKTLMWLGVAFFALLAFVVYKVVRKRIP